MVVLEGGGGSYERGTPVERVLSELTPADTEHVRRRAVNCVLRPAYLSSPKRARFFHRGSKGYLIKAFSALLLPLNDSGGRRWEHLDVVVEHAGGGNPAIHVRVEHFHQVVCLRGARVRWRTREGEGA